MEKKVWRKLEDSLMGVHEQTFDTRKNEKDRRKTHTFVAKERRINPHDRRRK